MKDKFKLISGPCIIDTLEESELIAEELIRISEKYNLELIFKGSYEKANRSSVDSFTGHGINGLNILNKIKVKYGINVITDVHESTDIEVVKNFVDYLQIPSFLCRQTKLLKTAAYTRKLINLKKGQFMSPEAMELAYNKIALTGNNKIMITERGTTFGYNNLVVDMTSIPKMKKFADTVIVDCTHSVQKPNSVNGATGGDPEMIETIALSAVAAGADGLFIEVHPNPKESKSDSSNILQLDKLEDIIRKCVNIKNALSYQETCCM